MAQTSINTIKRKKKLTICRSLIDEFQFIFECHLYIDIRKKYIKKYYWKKTCIPKLKICLKKTMYLPYEHYLCLSTKVLKYETIVSINNNVTSFLLIICTCILSMCGYSICHSIYTMFVLIVCSWSYDLLYENKANHIKIY